MKRNILFSMMVLAAGSLLAADASPKNQVKAAADALGSAANYSWQTTMDLGPNSPFQPGPTDGKTEKGGYTMVTMSFNDNTSEFVRQGTNAAVKPADGGWQTAADAAQNGGRGAMFLVNFAQSLKTPAVEAASLADAAGKLKQDGGKITGDMTEAGAKAQLTFRGRRGGTPPTITNPKGTVTFWIADGKLTKYQSHVTGTLSGDNGDFDIDRTSTTTISDVGTTKVDVPDAAKAKLP